MTVNSKDLLAARLSASIPAMNTPRGNPELLLSVHVCSNRPQQIVTFLDAIQSTAKDPTCFEVLVNIDRGDQAMATVLEQERSQRPFALRFIETFEGGFFNSHVGYNDLVPLTDPKAYFVVLLSDEMTFTMSHWDTHLRRYVSYFSDDIFRVRASRWRFRNYVDPWECGFAPDTICFTTQKWLQICGDWGTCFSSDCFQQYVAFYLTTYDPFAIQQAFRDIADPFLTFTGDEAAVGQNRDTQYKRLKGGLKAWFIMNSYRVQLEAKRRAMRLMAFILLQSTKSPYASFAEDTKAQQFRLLSKEGKVLHRLSYRVNRWKLFWTNNRRRFLFLNYAGGGHQQNRKSLLFNVCYYLSHRFERCRGLPDVYNDLKDRKPWRWLKELRS